jgi:hypothetical protein
MICHKEEYGSLPQVQHHPISSYWRAGEGVQDIHCALHTEEKPKIGRGTRNAIVWYFGHEGLVITKLLNYICKKSMGKAFYLF